MDKRLNNRSLMWGIPGFVLQVGGFISLIIIQAVSRPHPASPLLLALAALVALGGAVLLAIGLMYYARAKGRHPAWGLLGFLGLPGLIVLAVIPDREVEVLAIDDSPPPPPPPQANP